MEKKTKKTSANLKQQQSELQVIEILWNGLLFILLAAELYLGPTLLDWTYPEWEMVLWLGEV